QRDYGKLVELMIADLTQQTRSLCDVHRCGQGFQALFDNRVLIPMPQRVVGLMDVARHLQSPPGVTRGEQPAVDCSGAIHLPDPGELRFHQLRLESDGLKIQGHSLPDIEDLWKPWQGVEVQGELKALWIPRLCQERFGLRRVVAKTLLEALVPVWIPDPRPASGAELWMIPHDPMRLGFPAQDSVRNGLPVDRHVHGLPYLSLHKGHLRVQLVRCSKVHPSELPLVLHGWQFTGA